MLSKEVGAINWFILQNYQNEVLKFKLQIRFDKLEKYKNPKWIRFL
ncbi:hypothetical protein LEP1GSC133_3600 [Leptospira borgpetersenii serovar Pomona str. 200901868]|uniref:Uncharacterized protein n=1 Tax=Leptospira borgpetersenii serovar Pomona str. 200901868 TaxID=1192866 RepID=M6W937_LEPBO|nr:hypothetical protein LEP1GSC133_3600 [Leptospira borgpetersenii serovar Pomona str. 200901868]